MTTIDSIVKLKECIDTNNEKNVKIIALDINETSSTTEIIKEIEKIWDLYLDRFVNLEEFYYTKNSLFQFPMKLCQLTQLKSIFINNLTNVPEEIGLLKNLNSLTLSGTFDELPKEIGLLKELITLDIATSNLTSLPKKIGLLENLNFLRVHDSNLTSLPKEIGSLVNLEFLDLSANQLTTLPSEIGLLINLKELFLDGNPIETLPREILELKQLTMFTIDDDELYEESGQFAITILTRINSHPLEERPAEELSSNLKGFDPVMQDEQSISSFLNEENEEKNNIVIKFSGNFYLSNKILLKKTTEDNTAIFYKCNEVIESVLDLNEIDEYNFMLENTNYKNSPLFNLRKIGLPIKYVLLSQINEIINDTESSETVYIIETPVNIIENTKSSQTDNIIENTKTSQTDNIIEKNKLASVVSQSYYDTNDAVSSAHCQKGQEDILYNIVKAPINWIDKQEKKRKIDDLPFDSRKTQKNGRRKRKTSKKNGGKTSKKYTRKTSKKYAGKTPKKIGRKTSKKN
jgi:Leucine-rich repeat (LRR) protein